MDKCGGYANKKHKCGPFFFARAGDAKQNINFTWPYAIKGRFSHAVVVSNETKTYHSVFNFCSLIEINTTLVDGPWIICAIGLTLMISSLG